MVGSVGLGPYKAYFGAVSSFRFVVIVGVLFALTQFATSSLDIFLSVWVSFENRVISDRLAKATNGTQFEATVLDERNAYVKYYTIGIVVVLALVFHRTFAFFQMCLLASRNLHDRLFRGITRAWMSFFNANPSGRILNRFSKDIDNIDTILPVALIDCLLVSVGSDSYVAHTLTNFHFIIKFFLEMFAIIILVSVSNLWLLLPTLVMSVLFYGLRFVYVNTARSVKRIEALSM